MHEAVSQGHDPMNSAGAERYPFGAVSLGFLAVTALSGVALAPLYRPEAALESVEAIQGGLAWAWMLRGVHAYSAVGFLLATGVHLVDVVWKGGQLRMPAAVWWRSILLLPLALAGMLTGFLLRGDAEASAALQVARGVMGTIPFLGSEIATFLMGPAGAGLGPVAVHHAGTFTLLPWLLAIEHGRRAWPDRRSWVIALLASVAVAGVVPVSLGQVEGTGAGLLGPWYLLGLQGLLLDLPVPAAWLIPAMALAGLGLLAHAQGRTRKALLGGLLLAVLAWAAWTVRLLAAEA